MSFSDIATKYTVYSDSCKCNYITKIISKLLLVKTSIKHINCYFCSITILSTFTIISVTSFEEEKDSKNILL